MTCHAVARNGMGCVKLGASPMNDTGRVRLASWKEIAAYLRREVRTVIRWEKERGLPVHRVPGGKGRSVFAFTDELDNWATGESARIDGPVAGAAATRGRVRGPLGIAAGIIKAVMQLAKTQFKTETLWLWTPDPVVAKVSLRLHNRT